MQIISQAPIVQGTRVLVRYDLDVPVKKGEVLEKYRLETGLDTLNYIISKGAIPVICGHLGKPDGKAIKELSTLQFIPFFDKKLGKNTYEITENLRFDPREEENNLDFAKELISKTQTTLYINESFATSHRKHASIVAVTSLLPSFAGFRLVKEVETITSALTKPQKPLITIVGGAKIESKLPTINKFLEISDAVLLGGKIGIEWQATQKDFPKNLYLPTDYAKNKLDIGSLTIEGYTQIISTAKTIIWAGPLGVYTDKNYILGTKKIAQAIVNSKAFSLVGGGDTVTALNMLGLLDKVGFASTGGGAMLEFVSKGTLPGLEVLGYHG
ncbi:MAG: hypothetical protein ACD_22C00100G0017 [uncultured bacterium]|nr:MAG: hypothetical protein ACD_22C00100G0017 [uncultured bacterium]